jgi:catechol 2,3-dioxygenase-like lactoylglutathione lyase family enzyme
MIAVADIAWVRYAAPDLDLMEAFLEDFGLHRAQRTATKLYMRGCGPEPFVHVTEKGAKRSIGFAMRARSADDLGIIARQQGVPVMKREESGGGEVATILDPDGNRIEIVHGYVASAPLPSRAPFSFNPSERRTRRNDTVRSAARPSHVQRLGHVAIHTGKFKEMRAFYLDVLGMRISDSYHMGTAANPVASFLHCGLKQEFVDHHTVALIGDGGTGFEHCAFEVIDLDDVMSGNRYLLSRNRWQHSWGIGRHVEGSQVFDYWRDPFGNKIEHWTDGDLVNDDYAGGSVEFNPTVCLSQWGPAITADFLA